MYTENSLCQFYSFNLFTRPDTVSHTMQWTLPGKCLANFTVSKETVGQLAKQAKTDTTPEYRVRHGKKKLMLLQKKYLTTVNIMRFDMSLR